MISIIVPCYNQAKYMREALDSVLASTLSDWECIIVNDGSMDATLDVAREYEAKDSRFVVVDIPNGGLANARNIGIQHSHGKYILPLDSDDKIGDKYLELAVAHLEKHPETKVVCCECEYFGDVNGAFTLPTYSYDQLLWQNLFVATSVYRRSDYDRTSGYNTNMKHGHEDWDFWLSLLTPKDDVYKIPEVLFYYRKHGVSMISGTKEKLSVTNQQLVLNHLDVYKPYLGNLISWHNESLHYKGSFLALANSKTYQIGNIILYPFKLARSIFRKV